MKSAVGEAMEDGSVQEMNQEEEEEEAATVIITAAAIVTAFPEAKRAATARRKW